jgi:hypothetical protein
LLDVDEARNYIENALASNPDLTWLQVKSLLAFEYGLPPSEVERDFKDIKKFFEEAKVRS